jgi:hypothetical protein
MHRNSAAFLALVVVPLVLASGEAPVPGPPAPFWRNDSANVAMTAAFNEYLAETSFTGIYDGSVTDARSVRMDWDVAGDMPRALKDGVACWMAPDGSFPEGEVVIAGGLWPVGIAHEKGEHVYLNHSYSYDVARQTWRPLPLPPFEPGRTQGACLNSSLVIISGGDGGNVGPRVMRLSRPAPGSEWAWDMKLPSLPTNASRITATAHAIGGRWLVLALGYSGGPTAAGALVPYRLDLSLADTAAGPAQWEAIPAYPLQPPAAASSKELTVPISAVVGGKWLVFGGQYQMARGSAGASAWAAVPWDIATLAVFGPRPSGTTIDVRDAFEYDPM